MLNRMRKALRFAAFGVAAFALVQAPTHAQNVKLRVSTIPIVDTAPLHAAIVKGYFAAEGLQVDTTPTAGGAVGLPALAAGQVQITFSNIVSIALGAKQGLGFKVIAAGSGTGDNVPDLAGMVTKAGSPITSGRQLEGKRVAVNTLNNIIWLYARAWVEKTGGDPSKVTFLEVPFPQMIDAVRTNRVDAAFVVEPFLSSGIKSGAVKLIGWPYNAVQKHIPVGMYASTASYIKAHPDVIERFVRAYNKGVDWINQNKNSAEWLKVLSSYTRMKPAQIKGLNLPLFDKTVDAAGIDKVVALMRKNDLIKGAFDSKALLYKTATQPPH